MYYVTLNWIIFLSKESKEEPEENDYSKEFYGKLPMMQSQEKVSRQLQHVKTLEQDLGEEKVWVRGRLHTSRAKGNYQLNKIKANIPRAVFFDNASKNPHDVGDQNFN